ncbi:hypothetical protein [Mucilaginibacter sp.]|uniref:hypothetical protein n=1 Tax=Mucilaginibacter sp. TaxID=1882438 RepID=UPI0025FEB172|nr:hypothetical protein [Mucilaginibacter sp.]
MNKNSRVVFYFIFICTVVINITTLINGAQKHETWRIVTGAVSLGLMVTAGIIVLVKTYRQKNKQVS